MSTRAPPKDTITRPLSATDGKESSLPSSHALQLAIDIVLDSDPLLKCARAKEMANAFFKNIRNLAESCQTSDAGFAKHSKKLVVCMRTLSGLLLQKRDGLAQAVTPEDERDAAHHHKDKTDPR